MRPANPNPAISPRQSAGGFVPPTLLAIAHEVIEAGVLSNRQRCYCTAGAPQEADLAGSR
jgi:hypothetical protein